MVHSSFYDHYWTEVFEDACDFMESYLDEDTAFQEYEEVYDKMWATDEVCGNGYEGYPRIYHEMVAGAVFDQELMDGVRDNFGELEAANFIGKGIDGITYIDASIRCFMLGELGHRLEPLWDIMRKEYTDKELEG